ncbi:MAG: gliding motility-associated C-terminal domain-containing protein [Bacteroidota bacterium]
MKKIFVITCFLFLNFLSLDKLVAQNCFGSIAFNNVSDEVLLPLTNQMYNSNGFTWECWFKLNTPFGSQPRSLIMNEDPVVYEDIFLGFGWNLGTGNFAIDHLGFKVDGPNSTTGPTNVSCDYMPPGGFIFGTWYHAAGVMDYTIHTAKLYLNGILVDTKIVNSDPLFRPIQGHLSYSPNLGLGGNIDEVRIWKKVRTDSEIFADYDHCLTGNELDLISYYRCNQSTGSIVMDATINGNNGVFANSTSWSIQQPNVSGLACGNGLTLSGTLSSTICTGNTTTLSAIGATTYTWSTGAVSNSITVNPIVTTIYTVTGSIGSCASQATSTVNVAVSPTLSIAGDQQVCAGQSSTLTANGAGSYTWNPSNTLNNSAGSVVIATPMASTIYTVTGTTGLCTNTSVVTVSVNPSPTITATSIVNTSCGLSNGSVTITSSPANNTYSWSPGGASTTNAADSLASGNYTIYAVNGACSTSTVITVLGSTPLLITSSTVVPANCNANVGSITVSDNLPGTVYSWNPVVSSSGTANALAPGNYSLSLTNSACQTSSIFVVGLISGPTAMNITVKNVLCEADSGSVQINNITNGISPYVYSFDNSGFSSATNYGNLSQGTYLVAVKDNNGCVYTQTISIGKDNMTSKFDLTTKSPSCESADGEFFVNNITGGTAPYLSSFNSAAYTSQMSFGMLAPGGYTLSILDSNGCETPFILTMPESSDDYLLYIPNTFTPNKDEKNDVWFAKGACLNSFRCLIYNRWGEKIAELKNLNESWDGTYKGVPVSEGVYVYLIEIETRIGNINKAGHITVFR